MIVDVFYVFCNAPEDSRLGNKILGEEATAEITISQRVSKTAYCTAFRRPIVNGIEPWNDVRVLGALIYKETSLSFFLDGG